MKLKSLLKQVCKRLEKDDIKYAVCGGVAGNLYRREVRFTADLDFLIESEVSEVEYATNLLIEFGYEANILRHGDLSKSPMMGKKNTPVYIVVGRMKGESESPGLDFLMPTQGWTKKALSRAEFNKVDFGFGLIPLITIEDYILAKLSAVKDSNRAKDLDDIEDIIFKPSELELDYFLSELTHLKLAFPREMEKDLPKAIRLVSRGNRA